MSSLGWFLCAFLGLLLVAGIVLALVFGQQTSDDNSCENPTKSAASTTKATDIQNPALDARVSVIPKSNPNKSPALPPPPKIAAHDPAETQAVPIPELSEQLPEPPEPDVPIQRAFCVADVSGAGSSLAIDPVLQRLYVGIPSADRGLGQGMVFQLHKDVVIDPDDENPDEPIQQVRHIKFGRMGTALQKAGLRTRSGIFAAPDFALSAGTLVGTLFATQTESDVVQRLAIQPTPPDEYRMEDRGDVFRYYASAATILVAKRSQTAKHQTRLDVFRWDTGSPAPKLVQTIQPTSKPDDATPWRFAHSFDTTQDQQRLVVLSPGINTVHVYQRLPGHPQYSLERQFEFTPLMEDKEDFNQCVSVDANDRILISSPDNQQTLVLDLCGGELLAKLPQAAHHKAFRSQDVLAVWNDPASKTDPQIIAVYQGLVHVKTLVLEIPSWRVIDADWLDAQNVVFLVFDAQKPDKPSRLVWFKVVI